MTVSKTTKDQLIIAVRALITAFTIFVCTLLWNMYNSTIALELQMKDFIEDYQEIKGSGERMGKMETKIDANTKNLENVWKTYNKAQEEAIKERRYWHDQINKK